MKKTFLLLPLIFLLNSCAESVALLGTSVGAASNGKVLESSLNTAVSYGVKKQTGKSILEHAINYADEVNPEKKKEPCVSFIKKTNSELCKVVKKQIALTKAKIIKKRVTDQPLDELASTLLPIINEKSKIKYLD
jgi:hypothetical protein